MTGPRLRFAPSPTGMLHVGNARTAVVNWLVARRQGGALVLRIEDTDVERNQAASEEGILADLRWLGIDWDEGPDRSGPFGPYRQSRRQAHYHAAVDGLLSRGAAYRCFCDARELARARRASHERGESWRYPGTCRSLPADEAARRAATTSPAVRFRVPEGAVRFVDTLRGETGVGAGEIGDFVLLRADGTATYNLAVVVDDHEMNIDHVVRGEDHLSNTPRQVLLYGALGFRPPRFTHLPLVLAAGGTPLSKRDGGLSVADLRQRGVLATALVNHLALLGWSPPEGPEVLSPGDLLECWELEGLSPSATVFDAGKLEWLSGQHLARLEPGRLMAQARAFLEAAGHPVGDAPLLQEWWSDLLVLLRPRCHTLTELAGAVGPLLYPRTGDLRAAVREGGAGQVAPEEERDEGAGVEERPAAGDAVDRVLIAFAAASRANELSTVEGFREAARRIGEETGQRGRRLYHPLRLAVSGRHDGPELAALVPLIERGSWLPLEPSVPGVAERIASALGASDAGGGGDPGGGGAPGGTSHPGSGGEDR